MLVVILSLLAFPTFKKVLAHQQARMYCDQLFQAIQMGREQAILSHSQIFLEKDNSWIKGFFVKINNRILFSYANKNIDGIIHWRSFPAHNERLEFLANGFSNFENGTFWFCNKDNAEWAIMVSKSGRARQLFPDKNNQILDDLGKPLKC